MLGFMLAWFTMWYVFYPFPFIYYSRNMYTVPFNSYCMIHLIHIILWHRFKYNLHGCWFFWFFYIFNTKSIFHNLYSVFISRDNALLDSIIYTLNFANRNVELWHSPCWYVNVPLLFYVIFVHCGIDIWYFDLC